MARRGRDTAQQWRCHHAAPSSPTTTTRTVLPNIHQMVQGVQELSTLASRIRGEDTGNKVYQMQGSAATKVCEYEEKGEGGKE